MFKKNQFHYTKRNIMRHRSKTLFFEIGSNMYTFTLCQFKTDIQLTNLYTTPTQGAWYNIGDRIEVLYSRRITIEINSPLCPWLPVCPYYLVSERISLLNKMKGSELYLWIMISSYSRGKFSFTLKCSFGWSKN